MKKIYCSIGLVCLVLLVTAWTCDTEILPMGTCVTVSPICVDCSPSCSATCWTCDSDTFHQTCEFSEGAMWEKCDEYYVSVSCSKWVTVCSEMCASLTRRVVKTTVISTQSFTCMRIDGGNYCS